MPTERLVVTYARVDSLRLDPRNPRQHSEKQIRQLARSIASFGFNVPVVTDGSNQILAGHGRLLAAKKLKLQSVPTIQLTSLSESQARAFSIADNRLTENSSWDDRLLSEVLSELSSLELDFNLEDTGFSMGEIDFRIGNASGAAGPGRDPADEVPAHSSEPPVSAPGSVWKLGRHRLMCANALEGDAYRTLMQGRLASLVFTDPPYNVPIRGHVSGKGRIKHREFAMASGEMRDGQFQHFLSTALCLLSAHSTGGSLHYVCMDWRHARALLSAGESVYPELKNLCIWVKSNAGMGSLYRSQHELVFVFKNGPGKHRNNVELGVYGRHRTNVWQYPSPSTFGATGEEGRLLALHPTVKPVALIADALLDASARGDIVLDPFIGSGSTLIAAERVGRICCGMDLDPLYIDTAIRRWQRHSGEYAVDAGSGKRFDALARSSSARRAKAA